MAVVDDRGPVVFPVNFVLDRHMVVFRTDEGTKLDAAAGAAGSRSRSMESTLRLVPAGACVVRGEAVEVTDPAELARLRKLPLDPWAPGAKTPLRAHPARGADRPTDLGPGGLAYQGGEPPPGAAARPRR